MKKNLVTTVALASAMFVIAQAVPANSAEKAPSKNGLNHDLVKVSHDGYAAIRDIHFARIAIFNGETKIANEALEKANKHLAAATTDAQTFASDAKAADQSKKADEKSAGEKMDMIPIDGDIAIADTFVPSAEKKKHIENADEHLKSGNSKEALQELRLAEVDVVFTSVLMPLESTKKRVADAEKLTSEHKYYEANLALKAAEDGLVIDAVDLLGSPAHASTVSSTNTPSKK